MTRLRRGHVARFAAPAAFLLAVTIAVLLVRAGLHSDDEAAVTARSVTTPPAATSPRRTTTRNRPTRRTNATARFYTVESGDTFGSIATKEGTSIAELRLLNPTVDPTALQPGQRIRVK